MALLKLVAWVAMLLLAVPMGCFAAGWFLGLGARGIMILNRYVQARRALEGPPYDTRQWWKLSGSSEDKTH